MESFNPNCKLCDLWSITKGPVCRAGEGPDDAQVIIISENPLQSNSREILQRELIEQGISDKVYITNLVKCRTPDGRTPTAGEIKSCRVYLNRELAEIKPDYVLTLGATATKTMFRGKAKITESHGELIEDPKVNYIGMPAFSPSYTLRDPSKLPGLQADIARLARALKGQKRQSTVKWSIVRRGNVGKFLAEFIAAPEFSFDLETSGLFPHDGKGYIRCVGIDLPTRTWIIPGHMPKSPWARGKALPLLMQLLARWSVGKRIVAQNGKFDNTWLRVYCGMSFRLDFDTMLASHTLDENEPHGLKEMVRKYLDEPEYDVSTKLKQGQGGVPRVLYEYCAKDAAYTRRLAHLFGAQFKASLPLRRLFYRLVMPAARAMEEIEMVGLTVNLERMESIGLDMTQEKIELRAKMNMLVGRVINWNSPPQIAQVLFKELKLKCHVKTAKGNPSTGEEAILALAGQHEITDCLIRYRELAKNLSTYIQGLRNFMVENTLYITYKLHGTVTGRYSSRLHSIPRDGKIRNLVEAPPGWSFAQGDMSQAELRIAASVSGDLEMRRCFTQEIDIHWKTLMENLQTGTGGEYIDQVWKTLAALGRGKMSLQAATNLLLEVGHEKATSVWPGWKEGRKRAKAVNFGFLYGMYEKKFIETAVSKYGWRPTFDEAKQARNTYFDLYTGIPTWHGQQKRLVYRDGQVRSLSGRLRRLPGIYSKEKGVRMECERQAINAPVQGFIGDYKAMAMVEIHEKLDRTKVKIVGEHHDAILFIIRDEAIDEIAPQILAILRHPRLLDVFRVDLSVPMEGELEIGPWGAGKSYKEKVISKS